VREKQAIFVEMQETVFDALCELWPPAKRRAVHRIVAMGEPGSRATDRETALAESGGRVYGTNGAAARLRIPPATLESKIEKPEILKSRFKLC
jgi:hypothetical protein